jgi:UDP-glucuronate 4-epimerase
LSDRNRIGALFREESFDCVIHLAAQAGVRYSLTNPHAYVDSNLVGFANVLEGCRHARVKHLVFASSSSVYGANTQLPYSVQHNVDHPVSLYAATKKANELMAHAYAHLYRLPSTGLRFFTVYGPWGRPDMAYFIFTKAILEGAPIKVYNHGKMSRDMTYVDDVVEAVVRIAERIPRPNGDWNGDSPDLGSSLAPYRLFNVGNSQPVKLTELIRTLESELGQKAQQEFLPMMDGDVPCTFADVSDLESEIRYRPTTSLSEGIVRFVRWYMDYYHHGNRLRSIANRRRVRHLD